MTTPRDILQPLRRVRQYRDFTVEPLNDGEIEAILDVARWTGSSRNSQPWRFIVVRDSDVLAQVAEIGQPYTRAIRTATAAIAITMPLDAERQVTFAYDEARVAERILIAASMLGVGAGIAWVQAGFRPQIQQLLGIPQDRF